ncbi:nicotinate-nucleotide pyrophosphorylase [Thermosipho africanus H17ap60334]|jgi:nicotinate-nucleotide pyrophosphorylase (carboxylating)|uniref:nicotinate-nucleotide diphosphorylase (carboxylating) n=1 Tax=Thermosipho africanus (strain TCF52B) TaxID=484019 RepID=B7IEB9_THEAB|nr:MULTISPECIES: carboxylating nicotinate-nucleotide diphosphorylase [Thermosipho]HCF38170.1 carboxylating nicotinate-nucleotide diphosphorylase [Thermosipho africanus]ACJ76346.1 nicotinate-nucleotide pyrophosphorylase [Thermosipho africanus TCF52B]EKF49223.1 nicotinate-nucleotide pyrophosphorylase [Thermosipho africanus H17ap60334]MBZ4650815.1 nadC [Thermosipho sp. (in: thermotogales)]MDK2839465.1 hypothetical protein [Thermosipho sp. (in: thermotogales)]
MVEKIIEWIRKDEGLIDFSAYPLKGKVAKSIIILKDSAVLSGLELVKEVFKRFNIEFETKYEDGMYVNKNSIIFTLMGDAYYLLVIERSVLNLLSLMSGVATKVAKLSKKAKEYNIVIAATRKTIPFVGDLQKIAVLHGGGNTHRLNLSDTVMIKDNHKKIYKSIRKAVEAVKVIKPFTSKIEVEVEDFEELRECLDLEVDIIMLDNFSPEDIKEAIKIIKEKRKDIIIEVSGGINEKNLDEYLIKGVDVISIGKLTSEVQYVDFSMEVID